MGMTGGGNEADYGGEFDYRAGIRDLGGDGRSTTTTTLIVDCRRRIGDDEQTVTMGQIKVVIFKLTKFWILMLMVDLR
ncbi:unnamed protein product [Linum trigynum]|uniref:Uncharacterized protein n=1 Tax=Linum trigynum TaxID=586398 RepID=A0AAV2D5F3_9ROSI